LIGGGGGVAGVPIGGGVGGGVAAAATKCAAGVPMNRNAARALAVPADRRERSLTMFSLWEGQGRLLLTLLV
jgi:hypothetical protein